jgi:Leucine-rich repeat (LRR) protein
MRIVILQLLAISLILNISCSAQEETVAGKTDVNVKEFRLEGKFEVPNEYKVGYLAMDQAQDPLKKYFMLINDQLINPRATQLREQGKYVPEPDEIYAFENLSFLKLSAKAKFPETFDFSKLKELREVEFVGDNVSAEQLTDLIKANAKLRGIRFKKSFKLKELPDCLCELENLEWIEVLGSNSLVVPPCLAESKSLKHIQISGSNISGVFWRISSLESLKLDGMNSDAVTIPESIATLKNLKSLSIVSVKKLNFPTDFNKLIALESLYLNWIEGQVTFQSDFTGMSKLKCVTMSNSNLTFLPQFSENSDLLELAINKCKVDSAAPIDISKLAKLKKISLHGVKSITTLPMGIENCDDLLVLDFTGCGIQSLGADVSRIKKLKYVYLAGNPLPFREIEKVFALDLRSFVYPYQGLEWHDQEKINDLVAKTRMSELPIPIYCDRSVYRKKHVWGYDLE